jgi:mono/diheme cytochrome c family protein
MSSSGDHQHVPGSSEPRELSHPLLWTLGLLASIAVLAWVFFHFKQVGRQAAAGEALWTLPAKASAGPDHAALIADRSQAVLDRGEVLYGKNCAACHGPRGDTNVSNSNPAPRNFHTEPFKNPLGAGPYASWMVLTNGYGAAMPAFRNLSPEDRYAVVHFVAETWMKPTNKAYVANDDAKVTAQIPAAGAAGAGAEVEIDPLAVTPPETAYPLLAAVALKDAVEQVRLERWLADAGTDCGPQLAPAFARLRKIMPSHSGRLERLFVAAKAQDKADFATTLVGEDGAGSADPVFSLMSEETMFKLYARLAETATRMK